MTDQHKQQLLERLEQLGNISLDQLLVGSSAAVTVGHLCAVLLRALSGDESAREEAKKLFPPSSSFVNAINSVVVDCLRSDIGPEELAKQIQHLDSAKDGSELRNSFLEAYRSNFDQLKMAFAKSMGTLSAGVYPKVIGMDWSILSVIESTESAEIEEPLVEITFKTISAPGPSSADGTETQTVPELFKFVCNKNQLQDFQWKVTEACNFIHKLASKEK